MDSKESAARFFFEDEKEIWWRLNRINWSARDSF